MNDKMKIRIGISLVGLFTFTGSLFLIAKSDNAKTPATTLLPDFRSTEYTQQMTVPDTSVPFRWEQKYRREDGETFMPQFKAPGQLPQTRTRAS